MSIRRIDGHLWEALLQRRPFLVKMHDPNGAGQHEVVVNIGHGAKVESSTQSQSKVRPHYSVRIESWSTWWSDRYIDPVDHAGSWVDCSAAHELFHRLQALRAIVEFRGRPEAAIGLPPAFVTGEEGHFHPVGGVFLPESLSTSFLTNLAYVYAAHATTRSVSDEETKTRNEIVWFLVTQYLIPDAVACASRALGGVPRRGEELIEVAQRLFRKELSGIDYGIQDEIVLLSHQLGGFDRPERMMKEEAEAQGIVPPPPSRINRRNILGSIDRIVDALLRSAPSIKPSAWRDLSEQDRVSLISKVIPSFARASAIISGIESGTASAGRYSPSEISELHRYRRAFMDQVQRALSTERRTSKGRQPLYDRRALAEFADNWWWGALVMMPRGLIGVPVEPRSSDKGLLAPLVWLRQHLTAMERGGQFPKDNGQGDKIASGVETSSDNNPIDTFFQDLVKRKAHERARLPDRFCKTDSDSEDPKEPAPIRKPSVVVFGAGIAGLTSAHELAIRGFDVLVVEPAATAASDGDEEELEWQDARYTMTMQVGGVARTQWLRTGPQVDLLRRDEPQEGRDGYRTRSSMAAMETLLPANVYLKDRRPLPGEHGYRFFPSFYNHLFDTMRRTDVFACREHRDRETGQTSFDRLTPVHNLVFGTNEQSLRFTRSRPASFEVLRKEYTQALEQMGFEKRDLVRFTWRILKYMTTSSARREAEFEHISWADFLGSRETFSEPFWRMILSAPQALVAMDAEITDARTQGNIIVQLLLDQLLGREGTDSTLTGPTSPAWLDDWQAHLQGLGVRFWRGSLQRLVETTDWHGEPSVEAIVDWPVITEYPPPGDGLSFLNEGDSFSPETFVKGAEYYVVATDVVTAEQVTQELSMSDHSAGVITELQGFTTRVPSDDAMRGRLASFWVARGPSESSAQLRRRLETYEEFLTSGAIPYIEAAVADVVDALDGRALGAKVYVWFFRTLDELQEDVERWFRRRNLVGRPEDAPWLVEVDRDDEVERRHARSLPRLREVPTYGRTPLDRLQTFSGVQFYFKNDFRMFRSHIYFSDSEWGLSAISQMQFWRKRESLGEENLKKIRGIISVDLGNCRSPSRYTGKTVQESSQEEVATEVWRQFKEGVMRSYGASSPALRLEIPDPDYYHVDDGLVFDDDGDGPRVVMNRFPFLVSNVGDWHNRPRCEPWVPGTPRAAEVIRADHPNTWQAKHGGYRVHYDKVVFAGVYMKTFTRMTTMEAANESARHAVNAILDHIAEVKQPADRKNKSWKYFAGGDYCHIWDPERNELDDLEYFKRVDEMLHKAGKPHMFDILGLDALEDLVEPTPAPFAALVASLADTAASDWRITPDEIISKLAPHVSKSVKDAEALKKWASDIVARLVEARR